MGRSISSATNLGSSWAGSTTATVLSASVACSTGICTAHDERPGRQSRLLGGCECVRGRGGDGAMEGEQ